MRRHGLLAAVLIAAGGCTPAAAPDDTVSVRSAVNSNVVVTVLDGAGVPQVDVEVFAQRNNGSIEATAFTNASGQATLSLPASTYRFAVEEAGSDFYSGAVGHCATPACTTASITITRVDVTVVDTSGTPQAGQPVWWEKTGGAAGGYVETAANGHALVAVPTGSYRFVIEVNGFDFTSGVAEHCTVPGCTAATITTTIPVTVIVQDTTGAPAPNLTVVWESTAGGSGGWINTNTSGVAVLSVPQASHRFGVAIAGTEFFSGAAGHCVVPGCTSANITVSVPVVVTVTDTGGAPIAGKMVYWQNASDQNGGGIATNASGQATLRPPVQSVRFKVTVDGTDFYSGAAVHCSQPGCTSASISVSQPTVVTVVDGTGAAVSGKAVTPTSIEGITAANKNTNASGQATFRLPFARWSFKAKCAANNEFFFSGNDGHCFIPGGCLTAKITMPCGQCTGQPNGTACNDATACSGSSTCQSQKCTGASPMSCSASDQCHDAGACGAETGTCSNPPKADGATCTGGTCQAGVCSGGGACAGGCAAPDQCHEAGTCDPGTGVCAYPPKTNGTVCNDSNACTQTDTCQAGTCSGGNPVTCTASDQCHDAGTCNPATGACSNPAKADGASCNDGNACTQTDACQSGACSGANPVTCTAQDQCHDAGICSSATGVCSNPPKANGTSCNDSNSCTQTDTCQAGACSGGNPVTCTAQDQCHDVGTCNTSTGSCSNPAKANGTSCNDGNACTQTDTCQSGACSGGNPVTCTATDQCHDVGTCNSSTGACSNPSKANGTTCNDGNLCTQSDTCAAGACTGANPIACTAQDQCHDVGTCNSSTGICSNPAKANGTTCSDSNTCTTGDMCQAGSCAPGASSCGGSLAMTQTISTAPFQSINVAMVLATNPPALTPGDHVAVSAMLNYRGVRVSVTGDFDTQNVSTETFAIGDYEARFEYFSPVFDEWVVFARAAFHGTGQPVQENTIGATSFFNWLRETPPPGVHVPTFMLANASLDTGATGRWSYSMATVVDAPTLTALLDPSQSSGVRAAIRIQSSLEGSAGDQSTVDMTSFFGSLSAPTITDPEVTATGNTYFGPLNIAFTPSGSTTLIVGGTTVYTGAFDVPAIPGFPLTIEQAQTINPLALDFYGQQYATDLESLAAYQNSLSGTAFKTGVVTTGAGLALGSTIPSIRAALLNSPADIVSGSPVEYTFDLLNQGTGIAGPISFTHIRNSQPVIGSLSTVPPQIVPSVHSGASIEFLAPADAASGPFHDRIAITWSDTNGNVYGPVFKGPGSTLHVHPQGSLVVEQPVTQLVGDTVSFTVTARNTLDVPFASVPVHVTVTGVNAGTFDVVTGPDGIAHVSYQGALLGNDVVVASGTVVTEPIESVPAEVVWATPTGTQCTGRSTPLDIMFVIDASPSMLFYEGKIQAVRTAMERFIDGVDHARDQVGAVVFQSTAGYAPMLGRDFEDAKAQLNSAIDGYMGCDVFCPGGANFPAALDLALDELGGPRRRPGATPVIVFVSDGGNTGADPTPQLARLASSGVKAISVGVGSDIDGALMRRVASSTNDYFYAPSAAEMDWAYNHLNQDLCRNDAPLVDAGGDQNLYNVRLPDVLLLQGEVHDDGPAGDVRLTAEWTMLSGPAPIGFVDSASPVTRVLITEPGTYVVQLSASDGYLTVADRATIVVDPAPSLVGASLVVALGAPSPQLTGATETVTATLVNAAMAPIPSFPVQLTVAGVNPVTAVALTNATGVATFAYPGKRPGIDSIVATAFAPTFQLTSPGVTLTWNDPPSTGPLLTQGWIASPLHQSQISERVPIVLSPSITLTSGTLTYWPSARPSEVHTLAAGLTGEPGATLATLDTTVLANGSYIVKLDGIDDTNNQRVSKVLVTATGEYKPGRLVVEVTDFTIPIAGLPITVGRRYDSLEKDNVGDFGHGWSLALGHPKLEVDDANNVAITMPEGRRVTFLFGPQHPVVAGGPIAIILGFLLLPDYIPEAGVFGKLTSDGCPVLTINPFAENPKPSCLWEFDPSKMNYAPTTYTYTDPYGTEYVMGATGELGSIKDRQGNTLTFQPNGIISSTGKSVTVERDESGRITTLTSPPFFNNEPVDYIYTYDTVGDLVTVRLPPPLLHPGPENIQYTYAAHRLVTTVDPRGNPARTSTYHPDGRLATDTDALGHVTSYAYNLATRTTQTTFPDTGVMTQVFDTRGLVLSETNPLGHTTTHVYNANQNETSRTNAAGEVTTATYDRGNLLTKTDPLGTSTSTYTQNLLTSFKDALEQTTTIDYDDRGLPKRFADELGTRFSVTSSELGLPLTIDDAAGNRAYVEYDAAGNVTARTDWLGRVTRSVYDNVGNLRSETSAKGGLRSFDIDRRGQRLYTQDPDATRHHITRDPSGNITVETVSDYNYTDDRVTAYTYDAANRLMQIRNPDLTTVTYTRDFRGMPTEMTDELGRKTKYEYDKAGRLTKTTFLPDTPFATFTTRTYDPLGRLTSETDERDNTTTYDYQYVSRPGCGCSDFVATVTDPLLRTTTTTYDAIGRRKSVKDANNHTTTFEYDLRGHLTDTHFADGTSTHEVYDPRGRRISTTDQMSQTTLFGYDDQGQLTSVTDPLGNVTSYTYDADGNLASVTDDNDHVTTYEYDFARRKTKRTLPLGPSETFKYDPAGNLIERTDFRGKTTKMVYDRRSRMLSKVPDATLSETAHHYTYTLTGMRETSTDASGTTTYLYNERNRRLTKAAPAGTLTYTYDPAGNVETITSSKANGTSVRYTWDGGNQLVAVKDNRVGAGGTTTYATYGQTGRPATLLQPNGIGLTYAYDDPVDRITSMSWKQGASPAFASWAYTHNQRGQRLSATDITGRSAAYGYDVAARLESETVSGDPRGATFNGGLSYVLDGAGNRLSRTSTLAAIASATHTYNANDQRASDAYDANGNTIASDGDTFGYDFENRLLSKNNGAVTLLYDCDGNRVAKTVGGVTTQYLVDELNPTGYLQVFEEISGGVVQARYTYGTKLVSQTRGVSGTPATSYYGYDAHGNVTFLTDATGAVTDAYDYDAWGLLVGSTGSTTNTRLYAGEELDPDLGLVNLRARYYDPAAGRFMTLDPATGSILRPLALNPYLYANSDPVGLVDPAGLMAIEYGLITKAIAGAILFSAGVVVVGNSQVEVGGGEQYGAKVACALSKAMNMFSLTGSIGLGWNDALCAVRWRWPWSKDKTKAVPKEPTLEELCGPEPPEYPEDCDDVADNAFAGCMALRLNVGYCIALRDARYAECVATYEARATEFRLRHRQWRICMGQGGGPGRQY